MSAQRSAPPLFGRPGFGKSVEHAVSKLGRSEDLIIGKIGYASQNIRIAPAQCEACLMQSCWSAPTPFVGTWQAQLMDISWRIGRERYENLVLAELGEKGALPTECSRSG